MKKLLTFILTLTVMASALLFTACDKNKEPLVIKESDTYVVISVDTDKTDLTLSAHMSSLEDFKDMFVIESGMVVSINGIQNASDYSSCWMLYTDDYSEDCSNSAWGTVEYKEKTYNSAMFGAESLIVKDGCTYIWIYQTFN